MNTMLAAQMYTLREFLQTPEGIGRALEKVRAIGYEAVQMSAWKRIDPKLLREMADQNGVEICATHVSFADIVEHTERTIEDHQIYGTQYVGLGAMPEEYRSSAEGMLAFTRDIAPAAKKIHDAGLTLIYHNHNFEMARFGGKTGLELLMEHTDPDCFQFEVDTYWITAGGGDPCEWIRKMKGRMDVVHFKDMVYDPASKGPLFAEIGQGNLNWQGIIKACGQIGAQWHIVEQDICQGDPFESLAVSYRYLQHLGLR